MPAMSFNASAACIAPMMPTNGANTPIGAAHVFVLAGLGKQAVIAGRIAVAPVEHGDLAVEAHAGAGHERLGVRDAGAVDRVARREIVAAVDHDVGVAHELVEPLRR